MAIGFLAGSLLGGPVELAHSRTFVTVSSKAEQKNTNTNTARDDSQWQVRFQYLLIFKKYC